MMTQGGFSTPKLSVLSAVKNESRHIAEMIESFQAQSFRNWEIIFVDDGSTDDTVEIIAAISIRDPRVILAQGGVSRGKVAAFNTAFSVASGDVIALIGGDDRIPLGSLEKRIAPWVGKRRESILAMYKIRTFSEESRFDGLVLPKGSSGSSSGGSLTMSRAIAQAAFPIPESLPAEDIWLGEASKALADRIMHLPDIVLEYRIHAGNSNPRHLDFASMMEASHSRRKAWLHLLESQLPLTERRRGELQALWAAEQLRVQGKWIRLLRTRDVPALDRAAMAAAGNPLLYAARSRFYGLFSGLRGG